MPDTQKVLVVDDSPAMLQLIVFALRKLRTLKITEACDGVDAYKKLTADTFDMLITDINMPIMDGLKLVGMTRNNPQYSEIPIIIITTEGGNDDKQRAMELGATAYITKPIQAHAVVKVVKQLLGLA